MVETELHLSHLKSSKKAFGKLCTSSKLQAKRCVHGKNSTSKSFSV